MSNYKRILPRDLFNEAKLLKCIGKIALLHCDEKIPGLKIEYINQSKGFEIKQEKSDGSIYISNMKFKDEKGRTINFYTSLNDKSPWPLVMEYQGSDYYPINDDGEYQLYINLFCDEESNG